MGYNGYFPFSPGPGQQSVSELPGALPIGYCWHYSPPFPLSQISVPHHRCTTSPLPHQKKRQWAKKEGEAHFPLFRYCYVQTGLAQIKILVPGPVCKYCWIQHLTATCALPCIKGPDKIIKLLGKHAAFTFRTIHNGHPHLGYICSRKYRWVIHLMCQLANKNNRQSLPVTHTTNLFNDSDKLYLVKNNV